MPIHPLRKLQSIRYAASIAAMVLLFAISASAQMVTHFAGSTAGGGASDGTGTAAHFGTLGGIVTDAAGNIYVPDIDNETIRRVTPDGTVTTFAGLAGSHGSADGFGAHARFYAPDDIAIDHSGNLYLTDVGNEAIRKITPDGAVSTLAGGGGNFGSADGTGRDAQFNDPEGIAVDGNGNVYVADYLNATVRKITPEGVVTTLAGLAGQRGFSDGAGANARFDGVIGIAVDSAGNVYVSDDASIRKITPAGVVGPFAGQQLMQGHVDGPGDIARFSFPVFMAADGNDNIYVADQNDGIIRMITPAGVVSTPVPDLYHPNGVAVDHSGTTIYGADVTGVFKSVSGGPSAPFAGSLATGGFADGPGKDARFNSPLGIASDSSGNLFVADSGNHLIRKISPSGTVTTLAGAVGLSGFQDGTGTGATFSQPDGIVADSAGNLYTTDSSKNTIRKVTSDGVVTTIAGHAGLHGSADATGTLALFNMPAGIAADPAGNLYVADAGNFTIRKIAPNAVVTTFAGTAGVQGISDGVGASASFNFLRGLAADATGRLYATDARGDGTQVIREIAPDGTVTTLKPVDPGGAPHNFGFMTAVGVQSDGTLIVGDAIFAVVCKISQGGLVTTVAGGGGSGSRDGIGEGASFTAGPSMSLAIGPDDAIYVSEQNGHSIRAVGPDLGDRATIGEYGGTVGIASQLDTAPQNATAWEWSLSRRPTGSTAALSSSSVRNPTFSPDIPGRYTFQLIASNGVLKSVSSVDLIVEAQRGHAIGRE